MDAAPGGPAGLDRRAVKPDGSRRLRKRGQSMGDVALDVFVGLQVLIDEPALHRLVVDRDDMARCAATRRRRPGSPPTRKQDKIGRFQMLIRADAEPERIVLRKIGEVSARRPDHRYRQELGKFGQRIEGARIDTRVFGDDHRVGRLHQPLGQPMHIRRQGHAGWRRRHGRQRLRRRPVREHVFKRHIEMNDALRRAGCHLTGPDHTLIKRDGAVDAPGPFDQRRHQPVRTADAHAGVPLPLHRASIILTQRYGFARQDDQRHFRARCGKKAERSLQHAGGSVKQDGLWPPGHHRVAGCDIDREGFVPALDELRPGARIDPLPGQRLPDRRPFRSRRRHDVFDPEAAERLDDRLAAVRLVFHGAHRSMMD